MRRAACFVVLLHLFALPAAAQSLHADAIVTGARIWTGDPEQPYADALAVRDGRLIAVGSTAVIEAFAGPQTWRMRHDGAFIVPGFIDNHTHFERAGELLLGVNLLAVASDSAFIRAIRDARDRMPDGAWLTAGEWGAYEAWAQSSTGRDEADDGTSPETWSPARALIDSITPNTPVLVNRWDRSEYMANNAALELAGATCAWDGVECTDGVATGRLTPDAARRVRSAMPPKSLDQRLAEARTALADLASHGVTSIHDITGADQMRVYQELRARGELSVRVYARPTLDKWDELRAVGIRHGFGDEWIRIGGLKGFVDGIMGNSSARFYEPQLHSGERGSWRTMMTEPPGMLPLLIGADSSGHWPQVHAIGDEAIDTLLTMFEEVMRVNGPRERRFRMIHTQVMRDSTVAERMARLGVIAEVQPFHAIDDMRWMEERIGERARWAYAFRTLQDAGVVLSFGSDWPGTNAAWYPAEPLLGIYAAVTRQTLDGEPAGGWFPQERIDVESALRAYTVNNAWAADEDSIKGSLQAGKLADFVVLSASPFEVAPEAIKDIEVLATVVGGDVVYDADGRDELSTVDVILPEGYSAFDEGLAPNGRPKLDIRYFIIASAPWSRSSPVIILNPKHASAEVLAEALLTVGTSAVEVSQAGRFEIASAVVEASRPIRAAPPELVTRAQEKLTELRAAPVEWIVKADAMGRLVTITDPGRYRL